MNDTLLLLDPAQLRRHPDNVRVYLGDLSGLVDSIRSNGILEPLVVTPTLDEEGVYCVLIGQRRWAAAIKAGLAEIPCIVRPDLAVRTSAVAAALVENEQRSELTDGERVAAYRQLTMSGMSTSQIAEATGAKKSVLTPILAAARSARTVAALDANKFLTLEQAAALAEFEDDVEAVDHLVKVAKEQPARWEHTVADLRFDREYAAKVAELVEQCLSQGAKVVALDDLPDGAMCETELVVDEGAHARCPGMVYVCDGDDPPKPVAYCLNPGEYGHEVIDRKTPWETNTRTDGKVADDQKAQRAEVVTNNKAWRVAEPVRRTFIARVVARKTVPKNLLRFCVQSIADFPWMLRPGDDIVAQILGVKQATDTIGLSNTVSPLVAGWPENRLPLLLFAKVAAGFEAQTSPDSWRRPARATVVWFGFLVELGYSLSDVEQMAVGAEL